MIPSHLLVLLVLVGVAGGFIGGLGGPGGIPVILSLNLLLVLSPNVAAATASSIFVVATATATVMYFHSDGIDWGLAGFVGMPALVGTHAGARISTVLSVRLFEYVLGGVLLLAAVGIWYQQRKDGPDAPGREKRGSRIKTVIAVGSLGIGTVAGITGIGGPALTVPFMLFLGIGPITAVGAGIASGVLISTNTALGHVIQGNPPALAPLVVIGVPYVASQVLGWKYVHAVSDRTVSYSIAAIAAAGGVVVLF